MPVATFTPYLSVLIRSALCKLQIEFEICTETRAGRGNWYIPISRVRIAFRARERYIIGARRNFALSQQKELEFMEDKIIYMPCDTVEAFMRDAFVAAGVPAEDAALCANVLISADKRGIDSHGVGRLCSFYLDRIRDGVQQAVTQVEFVR